MSVSGLTRMRAEIAGATAISFTSGVNGQRYKLLVAPPLIRTETPLPGLFALDGDAYFGMMTSALRNRGEIGREIAPACTVAIGYDDADPNAWHRLRVRDFTPNAPAESDRRHWPAEGRAYGGLWAFLDVLEQEILPLAADEFRLDRDQSAFWGHSLGGLAVVATLLARPHLFRTYCAISPALWWNDCYVLSDEQANVAAMRQHEPRVFVGVGGEEETAAEGASLELKAELERARLIGNARALTETLRVHLAPAVQIEFACVQGETHITAPFATLRQALDMAFPLSSANGSFEVPHV